MIKILNNYYGRKIEKLIRLNNTCEKLLILIVTR